MINGTKPIIIDGSVRTFLKTTNFVKKNPLFVGIAEQVLAPQLNKLTKSLNNFLYSAWPRCFRALSYSVASLFPGFTRCCKKKTLKDRFVRAATNANSNRQKHLKNTLYTPITYSRITLKLNNTLEIMLKHSWNTHANLDENFPCHNDGHLEEKGLSQCNLASYFVSLNLNLFGHFF